MAKNDNLKDFLTDVADAIREKKGTTDLINPQDFSAEIASIQSGGGAVAVSAKAVNFRDYDGTILHSYTKDEFLALTELPPLPTREGLICQEWNWDFADAVEYVTEYGVLEVGATYITDDGKTRLYITIAAEGRMDVPLYFQQSVANGVTIDWGDNSATETLSGTGKVKTAHHYNAIGDYIISLDVADGCVLSLGHDSSSYCVMGSSDNANRVYCNMLQKVEMGKGVYQVLSYAFYYCYSLASVIIPKNTKSAYRMFYSCFSLISVVIPKGENIIPSEMFFNCYSLSFVIIPKSVTNIGYGAFQGCYSLPSLHVPQTITSITYNVFRSCTSLSRIVLPKGAKPLGSELFYGCYALRSIVLPEEVTSIASSMFYNCYSLVLVVIPKGVTSIESGAFGNCTGLLTLDLSALEAIPSLGRTSALSSIPSDCKIIVPDALYDTWIAATNWSSSNIVSKIIKKSEWDALNA